MAASADVLNRWAPLSFLEGLDSYFKQDDKDLDICCIYDLMQNIELPLTYGKVIDAAAKKHELLDDCWPDYICNQLQLLSMSDGEVEKMFNKLTASTGDDEPEAKKRKMTRLENLENRRLKPWTDRRISSLVDCVKELDESLCPEAVSLMLTNKEDKKKEEAEELVNAFENIALGQIIKLEGNVRITSVVKDKIPNGIAITRNVKLILDYVIDRVKKCLAGALYVVGPSGCSKTVAAAMCATYCLMKRIFHICLWDTENLAEGKEEEASYILDTMAARNSLEVWQQYGCDEEMYNLAAKFEPSEKYQNQQALLDKIVAQLSAAQRGGKVVVSIVDNCQSIMNEKEMWDRMESGSEQDKLVIRRDSRMRWILSNSKLGVGGKLVVIALASQHAKFHRILNTAEQEQIKRLGVPMDPLELLGLKRVLCGFETSIKSSSLWAAASKALKVSGCIPRHSYNHMARCVGGLAETQNAALTLFRPENRIKTSISSNVEKYLKDAFSNSTDQNQFGLKCNLFMRRILARSADVLSKADVDADPVIDYGILTPLPPDETEFRYINRLHQNVHLQSLGFFSHDVEVYIGEDPGEFERVLISRILARGITLRVGTFNGGTVCTLDKIFPPKAVVNIYKGSPNVYAASKSDRGLVKSILTSGSTFSLMITCPPNYDAVDVFVMCRQGATTSLYCIQITRSGTPTYVAGKFKNLDTAVKNFFAAVLEDKTITFDKNRMDVDLSPPVTRRRLTSQKIELYAVLVSLHSFASLNVDGIPHNRFVILGGKELLQNEFRATIADKNAA